MLLLRQEQHQIWDVIMFVTRGTIIAKVIITTLENYLQMKNMFAIVAQSWTH
jgi:hypothetical protein